jgi:serine/threonine protein kinase
MKSLNQFLSSLFKKPQPQAASQADPFHGPIHKSPALDWKVGDRFGEEMQIKAILQGGFSVVFLLGPAGLPQVMWAAKTFKDEFAYVESAVESFWHEAQRWIELGKHKNIVYAHRVFEIRGKPYIYLEFIDGGTLRPLLSRPLPVSNCLSLVTGICAGMEYAWTKLGLVHRDLKPENILIKSGLPKITDWGLSKLLDDIRSLSLSAAGDLNSMSIYRTKEGVALGTPPYMPPEQWADAKRAGQSADVYALGIMTYEMLAGELPFRARSLEEYQNLHKQATPKPLSSFRNDLPAAVEQCIAKALQKDPKERFGSCAEYGDALLQATRDPRSAAGIKGMAQAAVQPLSSHELCQQGFGLLHLRRDQEAITYFDRALQVNPNDYSALGWKSYCLGNLNRHQEAIESARKALAINPSFGHAWGNLGFSYSETSQHDLAIEAYTKCLEFEPSAPNYSNASIAFKKAGKLQGAIDCAKEGLKVDPTYYRLWTNLASALIAASRHSEAVDASKNAIRINPRAKDAWRNLAIAYERLGKAEEVVRCKQELDKINCQYTT